MSERAGALAKHGVVEIARKCWAEDEEGLKRETSRRENILGCERPSEAVEDVVSVLRQCATTKSWIANSRQCLLKLNVCVAIFEELESPVMSFR